MLTKIGHIGIIGEDLDRAVERFKRFGFSCTEMIENREMGVRAAFFQVGETKLEFIAHTSPDDGTDPMVTLVRRRQGAINHICIEVDDLEGTIRHFQQNGARLVEGCPRPGAHGRIAFFDPDTTEGVLLELCGT